jgi:hypothetical protein
MCTFLFSRSHVFKSENQVKLKVHFIRSQKQEVQLGVQGHPCSVRDCTVSSSAPSLECHQSKYPIIALIIALEKFKTHPSSKELFLAGHQWLTLVILATWKPEIRRISVGSQLGQIVHETPISKITRAK